MKNKNKKRRKITVAECIYFVVLHPIPSPTAAAATLPVDWWLAIAFHRALHNFSKRVPLYISLTHSFLHRPYHALIQPFPVYLPTSISVCAFACQSDCICVRLKSLSTYLSLRSIALLQTTTKTTRRRRFTLLLYSRREIIHHQGHS